MEDTMKLIRLAALTLAVTMVITGCSQEKYTAHPGAINTFDSQAYDWCLVTKTIIDESKKDIADGIWAANISDAVKTVLNNGLIPAYNVMDTEYQAYHKAVTNDPNASPVKLNKAIRNVSIQTTMLQSAKGGK